MANKKDIASELRQLADSASFFKTRDKASSEYVAAHIVRTIARNLEHGWTVNEALGRPLDLESLKHRYRQGDIR